MQVIGFGTGGCRLASKFENTFEVFFVDVGIKGKNSFSLPKCSTMEEMEQNAPKFPLLTKKIKQDTLLLCAGSGVTSGALLAVLEQIKHSRVTVVYIRPDLNLLNTYAKQREKLVFNVLQEYARSNLVERIYLFDNYLISKSLNNLSIMDYNEMINKSIHSVLNSFFYLKEETPIYSNIMSPKPVNKISTFGIISDMKSGDEVKLFNFSNAREKNFYFVFGEKSLKENKNLFSYVAAKTNAVDNELCDVVSYAIYQSKHDTEYAIFELHSNFIQS